MTDAPRPGKDTGGPQVPALTEAFRNNSVNMAWMLMVYLAATVVGFYKGEVVVPRWALESALKAASEMENAYGQNPLREAGLYIVQTAVFLYAGFLLGICAAIPPVYMMLSNALLTGAVTAHESESVLMAFPRMPAEIFEFLALWITLAWGAKLGLAWFHGPRMKNLRDSFLEGNAIFMKTVVPLLALALFFRIVMGLR